MIDKEQARQVKAAILAILLGLLLLLPGNVSTVHAVDDRPLDIVVVIDNSGSMGANDSAGLRYQAALMLIDLLGDNDRIAFVTFGTRAKLLNSELVLLSSPQQRSNLQRVVDAADSDDGNTSYALALGAAHDLLATDTGNQRAVFFLTDGQPTDETASILRELDSFQANGIPVYLILLNTTGTSTVNDAFEATGPTRISISNPLDVGRAFAFALTDLQPTTYLDVLEGTPGTGRTYQFTADVGPVQKVAEVTFVFLPASGAVGPSISIQEVPSNARLRNQPGGGGYTVYSYSSADAGAINGQWQFTSSTANVAAFAFIRSEIDLRIQVPASSSNGRRGVMNDLPFVLGVAAEGGDVASATVSVRFNPGDSCFAASSLAHAPTEETYDLNSAGLSENNTLFWRRFETGITQPTLVNVELKQLNRPLRLSRCFVLWPVTATADALTIRRPTANDNLIGGTLPIEVTLAPNINWQRATAYIQSPNGRMSAVALSNAGNSWSGTFNSITDGGSHTIRVLAQGVVNDNNVAVVSETIYEVKGGMSLSQNLLNLGEITHIGQTFEEVIELDTLLLGASATARFTTGSIRNVDSGTNASQWVEVDVCARAEVEGNILRCPVTISPNGSLPSGNYVVEILITAEGARLNDDLFTFRFTRPPSQIRLRDRPPAFAAATPINAVLKAPILFDSVLWSGDPRLTEVPTVRELRNVATREKFTPVADYLTVELQVVDTTQLAYQLILNINLSANLPAGEYEAELQLSSAIPNLVVVPDPLVIRFSKLDAYAMADFTQAADYNAETRIAPMAPSVWGLRWLNRLLGYRAFVTVPMQTFYMSGFPDSMASPVVEQVKVAGAETTLEGEANPFEFAWRNDGPLDDQHDLFSTTLVASVRNSAWVSPGEYEIRLRMEPPLATPAVQTVRVVVFGWGSFFWRWIAPAVVGLVAIVLGTHVIDMNMRPRLSGKLWIINGGKVSSFPLAGTEALLVTNRSDKRFEVARSGTRIKAHQQVLATITPVVPGKIELNFPGYGTRQLIQGRPTSRRQKIWYTK